MAIPLIIAAGVAAAGITKGAIETHQANKKARDERKILDELYANTPEYLIPDEYKEALELSKEQMNYTRPEEMTNALNILEGQAQERSTPTRMPGQDLMEQQLAASTGRGVRDAQRGATSAAEMLSATQNLYSSQNRALTDIQGRQMQYAESRRQQEMARMDAAQRNLASTQIGISQYEQGVQSQNLASYQNAMMNMANQKQQQFQMNELNPWMVQVGQSQSNLQGAMNQRFQGQNTMMNAPMQGFQAYMMAGGDFGGGSQAAVK